MMNGHHMDFTHKINHLSFGDLNNVKLIENNFGETFKWELDGRDILESKFVKNPGFMNMGLSVNYFLEISQVDYLDQTSPEAIASEKPPKMEAFQFRSSSTVKTEPGMPAIFFRYELSPIRIQYTMSLPSLSAYLTRVCAIVGGVYAVSSILESFLRNTIFEIGFGKNQNKKAVKKVKKRAEVGEVDGAKVFAQPPEAPP